MGVMWALLTFQSLGLILVRQRRIVLVSSTGLPSKNDKMFMGVFLSAVSNSIRVFLARVLAVVASEVIGSVSLSILGWGVFWGIWDYLLETIFLILVWPFLMMRIQVLWCL